MINKLMQALIASAMHPHLASCTLDFLMELLGVSTDPEDVPSITAKTGQIISDVHVRLVERANAAAAAIEFDGELTTPEVNSKLRFASCTCSRHLSPVPWCVLY
jgi:hypothetical protein